MRLIERRVHDPGILARWKDEAEVAVLSPAKHDLLQGRVCRQELVGLIYGHVVGFQKILG